MHLIDKSMRAYAGETYMLTCAVCHGSASVTANIVGIQVCKKCIIDAVDLFSDADTKPKVPGEDYPSAQDKYRPNVLDEIKRGMEIEREACAKLADGVGAMIPHASTESGHLAIKWADAIAEAIRGRTPAVKVAHHPKVYDESDLSVPDPTNYKDLLFEHEFDPKCDCMGCTRSVALGRAAKPKQCGLFAYDFPRNPEMERHLL